MKPSFVRLLENCLFPDDVLKPEAELDALLIAKVKQDVSHAKLDSWIAATIAELTDEKRAA